MKGRLHAAGPGATICFKPGVFRLVRTLHPLSGQTLVFLPGAVLNGSELVTGWAHQGSYWASAGHYQNLSDESWLPDPALMCPETPTACIYEDVFLDDRPLLHVQGLSSLDRANEVFFDKAAGTIYLATDPSSRLVEATVVGLGISSHADDVTVRGATIEKFAYDGIYTAADRWTIEDSDIHDNHRQGIGIYGGAGHVIRNSHIHHNGMIGITVVGVNDFSVLGNELDYNNYLHAGARDGGYHEGSVKIIKSHGVVFRNNWSHNNVGDGLWFDTDNDNVLIEGNILETNTRNGLHYEASFDATVRYNTIRNNGTDPESLGTGILNSTSKNVEFYENRIEGNLFQAIRIVWDNRGRSTALGEYQSANLYFHDNVIVLDDGPQSWVGVGWNVDSRVFTSNNRFQRNTYYAHGDGEYWSWRGARLTWDEWQDYGLDTSGSFVMT